MYEDASQRNVDEELRRRCEVLWAGVGELLMETISLMYVLAQRLML